MKTRIITIIFAFVASLSTAFSATIIDGISYSFNTSNQTAMVTTGGTYTGDVVIPETVTYEDITYTVTYIGVNAFRNCTDLTSIVIPNSVVGIGERAFLGCSGLTSLSSPNSVTTISDYAFNSCTGLTSVVIGDGVISIGSSSFNECSKIASLHIGNSVATISGNAFRLCKALTSVTIPNSVIFIGQYAFQACSGLTSITIGSGVNDIRSFAFLDCSNLKSVHIHDLEAWCGISFGSADANPLCYAYRLYFDDAEITDLVIPDGILSVNKYAFYNCKSLRNVVIPNGVTMIDESAFAGCVNIASVTLPSGVTSYGKYAFSNCLSLNVIHDYRTTPVKVGETVFASVNKPFCTLYVPSSAVETYQAADIWKDFYIVPFDFNTYAITATATNGKVAGTGTFGEGASVELTATANAGYRFTQWSDGNTDNPRMVTVTEDKQYTAMFTKVAFNITVNQNCNVTVK